MRSFRRVLVGLHGPGEHLGGRRRPGRGGVLVVQVDPRGRLARELGRAAARTAVRACLLLGIGAEDAERDDRHDPRDRGDDTDGCDSPHGRMMTGVPAGVASNSRFATGFGSRMQPFETAWPIDHGWFVPWIAAGPPCAQPVSTGENAEMPIAPGPNGPFGSEGLSRWFT